MIIRTVGLFDKVEPTLEQAQSLVGGYVEKITLPNGDALLINEEGLLKKLELNITATDLADYLVKNHSMPFRKAYQTTASIVNYAEKKNKKLNELNINELKKIEPKLTIEVLKIFNVKNSVNSKKSYGGTSFDNIKKMIMKYKKA